MPGNGGADVTDPFKIDGPAMISFSGGRTSGYMLRRCLDAGIGPDVHVLFANTGKERPETLDFVRDCSERWGVPIHWLERVAGGAFVEVEHSSAARKGQPFGALIADRKFLPNPVTRFCTQELKIRPMGAWMRHVAGYEEWTNVVGIRADEPRRVAKMRAPTRERWERTMPLADAGVTEADVLAFWKAQPFDLQLRTWEGNCDLCFLKGKGKRLRIMAEHPDLADWWIDMERGESKFRADTAPYAKLADFARRQIMLPIVTDRDGEDLGDCACTD